MALKTGSDQLFVRKSTGLVREASALDATIFNAVFSAPVGATLAWGVFFALSAFPGSDLVTATIISFVLNIPVLIMSFEDGQKLKNLLAEGPVKATKFFRGFQINHHQIND